MNVFALASLLLILAYLIYSTIKAKEIPDSISDTSYISGANAFSLVLCGTSAMLSPVLLLTVSENSKFAAFMSIIGLFLAALTPNYKTKDTIIHYLGGILSGVFSQILIAMNTPTILFTWALFPLLYIINKENSVFWAELICIMNVYYFLLSTLI